MWDIKGLFQQRRRLKSDHHWPLSSGPSISGRSGAASANGIVYVALLCCLIDSSAAVVGAMSSQSSRSTGARPQERCKLNPYYRPVCGSNHQTFPNRDLLNCFNQNRPPNQKIRVMRHGECEDLLCPSYEQLQGRWTMDNGQPVCANNGYTYGHVNQVRCLKGFIPSLDIMHEGGCMIHEVRESLGMNFQKKSCYEPRMKFEVNYVCSRANKTYENPFQALCANPRTIEKRGGKCGCPVQRSCHKMKYLTRSLKKSLRNVKEKFAVCGSDKKTYRSQHHLECARRFNSNLYKIHNGICQKNVEPCPESLKTAFSPTNSVCGSDGRSYINYEALVCASLRMHPGLKFRHSGACVQRYGSSRYF